MDRAHAVRKLEAGLERSGGDVSDRHLQVLAALSVYVARPALRRARVVGLDRLAAKRRAQLCSGHR